jgi:hypothetical protein
LSDWGFGLEAPKIEEKQEVEEGKIKHFELEGHVIYQIQGELCYYTLTSRKFYRYDKLLGLTVCFPTP